MDRPPLRVVVVDDGGDRLDPIREALREHLPAVEVTEVT